MSNVEHAFENFLYYYVRSNGSFYDEWKEFDNNLKYLSKEEIDAVETCGIYVLSNIFNWDRDKMKDIMYEDVGAK